MANINKIGPEVLSPVEDVSRILAESMGVQSPEISSEARMRLQLLELELEEKLGAKTTRDTKLALAQNRKESIRAEVLKERLQKESDQRNCSHKKPNGSPATAAMFDHMNKLVTVCQNCIKTWHGQDDIPPELLPDGSQIGGPGVR